MATSGISLWVIPTLRALYLAYFVLTLIINDADDYLATWAIGGALEELSHTLINKVSAEALVHIASTTTMNKMLEPHKSDMALFKSFDS